MGAAFPVLALALAVGFAWFHLRGPLALMRALAEHLGVRLSVGRAVLGLVGLEAPIGGHVARFRMRWARQTRSRRGFEPPTLIVSVRLALPPSLTVYPARKAGLLDRPLQAVNHKTGDAGFDQRWLVFGATDTATRLTAAARAGLDRLPSDTRLSGSVLTVTQPLDAMTLSGADALLAHLQVAIEALEAAQDGPAGWLVQVAEDPLPGVRSAAFAQLLRRHRGHAVLREAAAQAAQLPDPADRLTAAKILGQAGCPTLRALALDPAVPEPARAEALSRLVGYGGEADGALLDALQPNARGPLVGPILALANQLGVAPSAALLRRACRATDARVRQQAAAQIQALPDAEALLLSLLSDSDSRVAEAAAEGLDRVGGAGALAALEARADSLRTPSAVRRTCRAAALSVRERLGTQGLGGLSLASAREAGGLSISQHAAAGALAQVTDRDDSDR